MNNKTFRSYSGCTTCRGHGTDVTVTCPNCAGTGYDSHEDNPFAQCHQCYGEGETTLDVCPDCGGSGEAQDPEDE